MFIKKKFIDNRIIRKNSINKESWLYKHSSFGIIFIYNVITIIVSAVFYPILPILMNYSEDSFKYFKRYSLSYSTQYCIILVLALVVGSFILKNALRGIDNWEKFFEDYNEENDEKINIIRNKCINLPYYIFLFEILFVVIPLIVLIGIITIINRIPLIVIPKVVSLVFSLFSLSAIISFIYSKRIFTNILIKTYRGEKQEGMRISIRNKIFIQIIPMFIVAILFTSLIGYSRLVEEKGNSQFKYYKEQLEEKFKTIENVENIEQLNKIMQSIRLDSNGIYFFINDKGTIITSDGSKLSQFYIVSIKDFATKNNGRVYDEIGLTNLAIQKINFNGKEWVSGIKYDILTCNVMIYFFINFIVLLLISIFILYYLSKTFSDDISIIAEGLLNIAKGESFYVYKRIPVTSNDEIGDLIIAFNKIQDFQNENKKVIDDKNEKLTAINKELIAANEQLAGYATTVEELAIAKERNRFARDIHDTLGHTLTALVKMLEVSAITCKTDIGKTEADLQKAAEIAREGLQDIRSSISGLSSVKIEKRNQVALIEDMVSTFSLSSGVDIHFSAVGIDVDLNSVYIDVIYRTCQEAMTNAVRHGKAERVVIILRRIEDKIKLNILDDGIGCKLIKKSFGLSGMEQRVKELNGTLEVSSTEEGGFSINIEIPLDKSSFYEKGDN